ATFLSQLILNLIRWFFLKKNYSLKPFNRSSAYGFLIFVLSLGYVIIVRSFSSFDNVFLESAVALMPILLGYFLFIRYTENAEDLKERLDVYSKKIKEFLT
ncbi:MAG: hypothetical protein WBG42_14770, partial [Cryomorphaceae bacterium]